MRLQRNIMNIRLPSINELKQIYPKENIKVELESVCIDNFFKYQSIESASKNINDFLQKYINNDTVKETNITVDTNIEYEHDVYAQYCVLTVCGDRLETDVEYNKRIARLYRELESEKDTYIKLKNKFETQSNIFNFLSDKKR